MLVNTGSEGKQELIFESHVWYVCRLILLRTMMATTLSAREIPIPALFFTLCYAPNFEKVGSILVLACAFVSFIRPSVRSKKNSS